MQRRAKGGEAQAGMIGGCAEIIHADMTADITDGQIETILE